MTIFRQLISPADPATWVGRILGLLLLIFFGSLVWQLAPMLLGDLSDIVTGILRGGL